MKRFVLSSAKPIPLTAAGGTMATAMATPTRISGNPTNSAIPAAKPRIKAIKMSIKVAWFRITICVVLAGNSTISDAKKVIAAAKITMAAKRRRTAA